MTTATLTREYAATFITRTLDTHEAIISQHTDNTVILATGGREYTFDSYAELRDYARTIWGETLAYVRAISH